VRPNVIDIVRSWTDNKDRDIPALHVLLMPDVLVDGDENVKILISQRN